MSASSEPKFDLLVYAGAGEGQYVEPLLAQARRMVLIDADRDCIKTLNERFAQNRDVQIVEAALGNGSGPALFRGYNVSKANSFRDLKALANLYAGIQSRSETEIDKVDAANLILSFISVQDQSVALIIDVNGDEGEILDSLAEAEAHSAIGQVTIHCGASELFDGALTAQAAGERLEQLGYVRVETFGAGHFRRVRGMLPDADTSTAATVSDLINERGGLRADLERATTRVETLEENLEALRMSNEEERLSSVLEINRLTAELRDAQTTKSEFEQMLGAAHSEKVASATALETARSDNEALKAAFEDSQSAAEAEAAELRERLRAVKRDRDVAVEREKRASRSYQSDLDVVQGELQIAERDRDAAIEREKKALNAHQKEVEAFLDQLAAAERDRDAACEREALLSREREDMQAQRDQAQQEASKAREDLAVATRLQSMAQNDVRSLQEKYRNLLVEKERLDSLLARLNSRLTEASAYLEFLDEQPSGLGSLAVSDASEKDADPGSALTRSAHTGRKPTKDVQIQRSTGPRKRS